MDVVLVAVQDDVVKVEEEDVEVVVCLDLDTLERRMKCNGLECIPLQGVEGELVLFSSTAAASWV